MKRRVLLTGLVSMLLAACILTAPEPTVTPAPTTAFSPTSTPAIIPTATLARVTLTVKDTLVNCRFGPGTGYALINELGQNVSARVIGRNASLTWWYIRDPGNPNGFCWVSANVAETQGAVEELPVVQAPVTNEVTTDGPAYVTWRWEASTGAASDNVILVFEAAGKQVINDYYQIGAPNEYWVKLHITTPSEIVKQVNIPVSCRP
jgi:hypothetical protein